MSDAIVGSSSLVPRHQVAELSCPADSRPRREWPSRASRRVRRRGAARSPARAASRRPPRCAPPGPEKVPTDDGWNDGLALQLPSPLPAVAVAQAAVRPFDHHALSGRQTAASPTAARLDGTVDSVALDEGVAPASRHRNRQQHEKRQGAQMHHRTTSSWWSSLRAIVRGREAVDALPSAAQACSQEVTACGSSCRRGRSQRPLGRLGAPRPSQCRSALEARAHPFPYSASRPACRTPGRWRWRPGAPWFAPRERALQSTERLAHHWADGPDLVKMKGQHHRRSVVQLVGQRHHPAVVSHQVHLGEATSSEDRVARFIARASSDSGPAAPSRETRREEPTDEEDERLTPASRSGHLPPRVQRRRGPRGSSPSRGRPRPIVSSVCGIIRPSTVL